MSVSFKVGYHLPNSINKNGCDTNSGPKTISSGYDDCQYNYIPQIFTYYKNCINKINNLNIPKWYNDLTKIPIQNDFDEALIFYCTVCDNISVLRDDIHLWSDDTMEYFKKPLEFIKKDNASNGVLYQALNALHEFVYFEEGDKETEQDRRTDGDWGHNRENQYTVDCFKSLTIGYMIPLANPLENNYGYDLGLIPRIKKFSTDSKFDVYKTIAKNINDNIYKNYLTNLKDNKYTPLINEFTTKNETINKEINKKEKELLDSKNYTKILNEISNDLDTNINYLKNNNFNFDNNKGVNDDYNNYLKNNMENYKKDTVNNNKILYDSIYLQNKILTNTVNEIESNLNMGERKSNFILKNKNFFRQSSYYLYIIYYIVFFILILFLIFFETSFSDKQKYLLIFVVIFYPYLMIHFENFMYNFWNYFFSIFTSSVYEYKSIL